MIFFGQNGIVVGLGIGLCKRYNVETEPTLLPQTTRGHVCSNLIDFQCKPAVRREAAQDATKDMLQTHADEHVP